MQKHDGSSLIFERATHWNELIWSQELKMDFSSLPRLKFYFFTLKNPLPFYRHRVSQRNVQPNVPIEMWHTRSLFSLTLMCVYVCATEIHSCTPAHTLTFYCYLQHTHLCVSVAHPPSHTHSYILFSLCMLAGVLWAERKRKKKLTCVFVSVNVINNDDRCK